MPLELHPMQESDMRAYENVTWAAFKDDLMAVLYPNGFNQEDIDHGIHWNIKSWREHPEVIKYMKVIDTDLPEDDSNGKMVGMTRWKFYTKHRTEAELDQEAEEKKAEPLSPGLNGELIKEFFGEVSRIRREQMGGQPNVLLDMIATLPQHQRRGVGAMLLRWGIKEADALGLPMYLEASPVGRPQYAKNGFEVVADMSFDGRKWGSDKELHHVCMLRPAMKSNGSAH